MDTKALKEYFEKASGHGVSRNCQWGRTPESSCFCASPFHGGRNRRVHHAPNGDCIKDCDVVKQAEKLGYELAENNNGGFDYDEAGTFMGFENTYEQAKIERDGKKVMRHFRALGCVSDCPSNMNCYKPVQEARWWWCKMRKYMCVYDQRKECVPCGDCDYQDVCDVHGGYRYVCADVAMRYARMKERRGYELARSSYGLTPDYTTGYPVAQTLRYATYSEAQQATKREQERKQSAK